MDDPAAADDEKKPFDALGAQDDDLQPDPDEHIMLESGHGRVWLVKVFPLPNQSRLAHLGLPQDPEISDGALVQVRRRGRPAGENPHI